VAVSCFLARRAVEMESGTHVKPVEEELWLVVIERELCGLGAALGHAQLLGCFVKRCVTKLLSPSRYLKREKLL